MKPHPRSNSVVDSVASASESIRLQRVECLLALEQKGIDISKWIQQTIKLHNAKLIGMGPTTSIMVDESRSAPESLPTDVVAWIDSLKKRELQQELRGRELNTTGLKDELRARLVECMVEERRKAVACANPHGDNEKSHQVIAEVDADPVDRTNKTNEMEVDDISNNEHPVCNTSSESMEVECVSESAVQSVNLNDEGVALVQQQANEKLPGAPPPQSTKAVRKSLEKSSSSAIPKHAPTMNGHRHPSPVRTSRSPLRRMQAGVQSALKNRMQTTVQSALKNLRPVSPKKPTTDDKRSPPKAKKEVVVIPENMSLDSTEFGNTAPLSETERPISAANADLKSTTIASSDAASRALTTQGMASISATSKLGNLNISSDSVKQKNNARMARIAEMRNKSKAVMATSSSKLQSGLSTYTGLKYASSSAKNATSANSKRHILANQIREKTLVRLGEAAAPSNAAPPQNQSAKKPILMPAALKDSKNTLTPSQAKVSTPPPPVASARSPILSPLDTYEMSDHGGSSDTDEEEERSRRAGKRIPKWANKENLRQALQYQYTDSTVDPDELFGEVNTCNLEEIFGRRKSKYQKRTSSGNWARDKATAVEKLAFKRQMGYDVKG